MPGSVREPGADLRIARRVLEGLAGVRILEDWRWEPSHERWLLRCRLFPDMVESPFVSRETDWFVLVESIYPWGEIGFYPAKENSLLATFPHQEYNGVGPVGRPWRDGKLCLSTDVRVLGRLGSDDEPIAAAERLRWHVERALGWLECASRGELVLSGEPFELPQFPLSPDQPLTVAFAEDVDSFETWHARDEQIGKLELVAVSANAYVATCFRTIHGAKIFVPRWGTQLAHTRRDIYQGIWLRCPDVPVLEPWQAPMTWGELRRVGCSQGWNLDALLKCAFDDLHDGRQHIALVGFPISAIVGEAATQMHWQALLLPMLSYGKQARDGFRPGPLGYWMRDRDEHVRNDAHLAWVVSENWHADELGSRGRLPVVARNQTVLVIGVGAMGAVVAELLVRAGTYDVLVMDGDTVKAGNLVRHPLGIASVQAGKAEAVATRLNAASPHAKVTSISRHFPPFTDEEIAQVQRCDIVIDCTGDDTLLHHLEVYPWEGTRFFYSFSLGAECRRLYGFAARGETFPHTTFADQIAPWLQRDRDERTTEAFVREGVGCWHPVFPARADDIWLFAAVAVKQFAAWIASPPTEPELVVFAQQFVDGECHGILRADAHGADCAI